LKNTFTRADLDWNCRGWAEELGWENPHLWRMWNSWKTSETHYKEGNHPGYRIRKSAPIISYKGKFSNRAPLLYTHLLRLHTFQHDDLPALLSKQ
jgi:hypothetical protein